MINEMTESEARQEIYGEFVEYSGNNPFAHQYKPEKHESTKAIWQQNKQLIISNDFNLNPFAVAFIHIWQDNAGFHHHQFDEGEITNGSIPAMIDFVNYRHEGRYFRQLQAARLSGDAMGNNKDISQRDNSSLYQQLLRGWNMNITQLSVSNNPTHENSRSDVNYVLLHHPDFIINPDTCPNTCRDMRTVQCDAFGKIIKRDRKDINQRADYLDGAVRYPVHNFHRQWINRHQQMNRPNGLQKTSGVLTH
jgi:hypothetical protein